MAVFFPQGPEQWRCVVEGLLRQHHVDVQRLWGRIPQPSALTPSIAPNVPTPATMGGGGGGGWEFGKLDQAVAAGVLSSGETFTIWKGPAFGANDAPVGSPIDCHYATDDMDTGTYIIATRKIDKWYVQPWECPT